jgi:hypothetical protein
MRSWIIDFYVFWKRISTYASMSCKLRDKSLINKLFALCFVSQHHQTLRLNQARPFRRQVRAIVTQVSYLDAIQSHIVDDFDDFHKIGRTPTRTLQKHVHSNTTIMIHVHACVLGMDS